MQNEISIFNYALPSEYLRDIWQEKKKKNASFSIRSWSQQMGMKSHNGLYEVIKGKRLVPKKYIPRIKESLKLSNKESFYFETLVDLSRTADLEEREIYIERLEKLRGGRLLDMNQVRDFKVLKDPLCACLLEMAYGNSLPVDLKKIKPLIRFERSIKEIEQAVKLLTSSELLDTQDGKLVKNKRHLTSTEDIKDLALVAFHKELSKISIDQLEKQNVDMRDYRGTILNIDMERIKEAKVVLQDFMKDFINEFESPPDERRVKKQTFCLHTKLFSLTKDL